MRISTREALLFDYQNESFMHEKTINENYPNNFFLLIPTRKILKQQKFTD